MTEPPQRDPLRYAAPAAFLIAVVFLLWALSASGTLTGWREPETAVRATTTQTTILPLVDGEETPSSTTQTSKPASTSTTARRATTSTAPTGTTGTTLAANGQVYVVQPGDNPVAIAERHGVSVSELMELNNISDPLDLRVGTTLRIPPAD